MIAKGRGREILEAALQDSLWEIGRLEDTIETLQATIKQMKIAKTNIRKTKMEAITSDFKCHFCQQYTEITNDCDGQGYTERCRHCNWRIRMDFLEKGEQ